MRSVVALSALPWRDRLLLVEAFATVVATRLALRLWSLDRLRAWSRRQRHGGREVERIVWALGVAARRVPGTRCLCSAFALQRLMSRHGHACEVHVGVAKEGAKFTAHAWVIRNDEILIDTQDHGGYVRLVAWPTALVPRDGSGPA